MRIITPGSFYYEKGVTSAADVKSTNWGLLLARQSFA